MEIDKKTACAILLEKWYRKTKTKSNAQASGEALRLRIQHRGEEHVQEETILPRGLGVRGWGEREATGRRHLIRRNSVDKA